MTQIAEAYFHVRRVSLSAVELEKLGNDASRFAAEIAKAIYPPDTILDVRLEDGSVKGWVTVIGVIAYHAYGIIADYSSFKQSVPEIVNDARKFSSRFNERITSTEELRGGRIYRLERRTKTPGKIKRLLDKREWLERHRSQLSESDVERLELEIERILQEVLADIEPGSRAALRQALGEEEPRLPPREAMRVALPSSRQQQAPLFVEDLTEAAPGADYHRRFKLSDAPFAIGEALGGDTPQSFSGLITLRGGR
jgi:hypothetical protein